MNPLLSSFCVCFFSCTTLFEGCGADFTLIASALVVNTNDKATAATVLMSTFFALKFLFAIIIIFLLIINNLLLCRLFPFDDAKIWRFSRRNKFLADFPLSLLSFVSFRRCKDMAFFKKKQISCRLSTEFVTTAAHYCDKVAARQEMVSQKVIYLGPKKSSPAEIARLDLFFFRIKR